MGATEVLARFAVETDATRVPPEVLHQAKRCFINYLAVALGGGAEPPVETLLEWVRREGGSPQATVIGKGLRVSLGQAALVNGYLAHIQDYDDTHFPTILHPSAPIWPAVQAAAEGRRTGGGEVLTAFAVGAEVACRLSLSVHPWHYDQGWHITGTAGVFGAAAGAGRALGLRVSQMVQALGLAGTQASGVREVLGAMTKAMHPAKAASNGLQAAALAGMGFTSTEAIVEGRRGFWAVLSGPGRDEAAIDRELGRRWELPNIGLKPYANGVVSHPLQDAVIALRNTHGLKPDQVSAIHARVHPLVLELMDRPELRTGLDGKFSYQHCAAAALVDGSGHPAEFTDERASDPVIAALRGRVSATADPLLGEDETYVTITLTDGGTLEQHVAHATGSPDNPMTDEALEAKFRALATPALPPDQAERLLQAAWRLDEAPNMDEVTSLMVPPGGAD